MASVDTTLSDFLALTRQVWQQRSSAPQICIGNPAGDADSIISAITYGFVASQPFEKRNDNENPNSSSSTILPIVSIPKVDLKTQRPETVLLMNLAGISLDDLIDVDEFQQQHPPKQGTKVTLLDHNRWTLQDRLPQTTVVEILDHHLDEGYHVDTACAQQRTIAFADNHALVASTCTLVVERMLQQGSSTTDDTAQCHAKPLSPQVSILLLGTILLDSVNMLPQAGKGTPRDAQAIEALLQKTDWQKLPSLRANTIPNLVDDHTSGRINTNVLFQALQNAKFDVEFWKSLSVRDALRLDYKHFDYVRQGQTQVMGVSTVLLSFEDFACKTDWVQALYDYQVEHSLDLLGVMLAYQDEKQNQHRQLILCANPTSFPLTALIEYLMTESPDRPYLHLTERVGVVSVEKSDDWTVRVFEQGNAKASRKQVVPILLHHLQESK